MGLKIVVPSGIGDFSWMWSKLIHVRDQIDEIKVLNGWPHRTVPFVEMCGVTSSYVDLSYEQILMDERVNGEKTWQELVDSGRGMLLLEANKHLEAGNPLSNWMPDLPTNFHYPLEVPQWCVDRVDKIISELPNKPLVGISCASYRGSEAWQTWGMDEWEVLLSLLIKEGFQPVMLGGFWDDLTSNLASKLELPDLVGKTNTAQMVEVQRRLFGYIGFSSGLGVIRTVVNKGCMMLWPEFQEKLSTPWAPPEYVESGLYTPVIWQDPHYLIEDMCHYLQMEEQHEKEKEIQKAA